MILNMRKTKFKRNYKSKLNFVRIVEKYIGVVR